MSAQTPPSVLARFRGGESHGPDWRSGDDWTDEAGESASDEPQSELKPELEHVRVESEGCDGRGAVMDRLVRVGRAGGVSGRGGRGANADEREGVGEQGFVTSNRGVGESYSVLLGPSDPAAVSYSGISAGGIAQGADGELGVGRAGTGGTFFEPRQGNERRFFFGALGEAGAASEGDGAGRGGRGDERSGGDERRFGLDLRRVNPIVVGPSSEESQGEAVRAWRVVQSAAAKRWQARQSRGAHSPLSRLQEHSRVRTVSGDL